MVNFRRILCVLFLLLALAELRAATNDAGCLLAGGGVIRGPVGEKKIALVFTGHSFAEGGATILDELKKHHAPAVPFGQVAFTFSSPAGS